MSAERCQGLPLHSSCASRLEGKPHLWCHVCQGARQEVELTIEQRLAVAQDAVLHLAAKLELRTRQLADARQQFTEELAPLLRQAKREAWTACTNAHLEYALEGDISALDNPYEEEENELA